VDPTISLSPPALALDHVRKVFPGGVVAVDDLTLEAAPGELLVLTGPSGCGKTTTLRLVAGLERPTGGGIAIGGRKADGLAPRHRDVAMVFQHGALYPHLSVRENMAFGLWLRGVAAGEIDRRVAAAAAALDIADLLPRRPGQLSGGQQQRVALGRALVRNPKLFLLDEPLGSLDAPLRSQLRHEIRRLHSRLAAAWVYVTHDQTEAMALGQRIAVLSEGRLQQLAPPETLYHRPANRFVAAAIGSPAMNFFPGRIQTEGEHVMFIMEDLSAATIAVPGGWKNALRSLSGQAVTLGIRPEHFALRPAGTPNADAIRAIVEAVERLGGESYVYLRCGPQTFLVRTVAAALRPGESLALIPDPDRLHFFDAVTQRSLGPR
jgi:multiple sugar transport system ATP-binding protein